MDMCVTIDDSIEAKTASILGTITTIQHFSNQREIYNLLSNGRKNVNEEVLLQLILIEYSVVLIIESEQVRLNYQIVLARTYDDFLKGLADSEETYMKYIIRVTSYSELENCSNNNIFKTLIEIIESQNASKQVITAPEFFSFNKDSLIKFNFTSLANAKYGLFIIDKNRSGNNESTTSKTVELSKNNHDLNTFIVSMGPSPYINLYDNPFPVLNQTFHLEMHNRQRLRGYSTHYGFREGYYSNIKSIFNNEDKIKEIVKDYRISKMNESKSLGNNDIYDDIDWTCWNDDRDTDQQSEEFWNQF